MAAGTTVALKVSPAPRVSRTPWAGGKAGEVTWPWGLQAAAPSSPQATTWPWRGGAHQAGPRPQPRPEVGYGRHLVPAPVRHRHILRHKHHVRQGDEVLEPAPHLLHLDGHLDVVLVGQVVKHGEEVGPVPALEVNPGQGVEGDGLQVLERELGQAEVGVDDGAGARGGVGQHHGVGAGVAGVARAPGGHLHPLPLHPLHHLLSHPVTLHQGSHFTLCQLTEN